MPWLPRLLDWASSTPSRVRFVTAFVKGGDGLCEPRPPALALSEFPSAPQQTARSKREQQQRNDEPGGRHISRMECCDETTPQETDSGDRRAASPTGREKSM